MLTAFRGHKTEYKSRIPYSATPENLSFVTIIVQLAEGRFRADSAPPIFVSFKRFYVSYKIGVTCCARLPIMTASFASNSFRSLRSTLALVASLLLTANPATVQARSFGGDARKVKQATEAAAALSAAQHTATATLDARSAPVDAVALAEAARLRVDRYATTERLTRELATALALDTNPAAVERLQLGVSHLLGADTPAGFDPATADVSTLPELTARHTREMQRWLASWLPQTAYDQYVALLDTFQAKAN